MLFELSNLLNSLLGAEQEALVPPDLKAAGWRYQDWPATFTPEAWDYLQAIIGEGEYQVIVSSSGTHPDGTAFKRGQMLISPQGYTHLSDRQRMNRIAVERGYDWAINPKQ